MKELVQERARGLACLIEGDASELQKYIASYSSQMGTKAETPRSAPIRAYANLKTTKQLREQVEKFKDIQEKGELDEATKQVVADRKIISSFMAVAKGVLSELGKAMGTIRRYGQEAFK